MQLVAFAPRAIFLQLKLVGLAILVCRIIPPFAFFAGKMNNFSFIAFSHLLTPYFSLQ